VTQPATNDRLTISFWIWAIFNGVELAETPDRSEPYDHLYSMGKEDIWCSSVKTEGCRATNEPT
jgi:hypothetical protein